MREAQNNDMLLHKHQLLNTQHKKGTYHIVLLYIPTPSLKVVPPHHRAGPHGAGSGDLPVNGDCRRRLSGFVDHLTYIVS